MRRSIFVLIFGILSLWCWEKSTFAQKKIKVVTSFTILADFAQTVGGKDLVEVHPLVGPNSDPHVFRPTPDSAKQLALADLVIINGLGFEGWINRLVKASGYKGPVIIATKGLGNIMQVVDPLKQNKIIDPHTWLTIQQALVYIDNIEKAFIKHMPQASHNIRKRAQDYREKLLQTEQEIKRLIETVPPSKREVITAHDAFGYFGRAYGIRFHAPQGVTTESEASAKDVANLIQLIKKKKIKAVFVENIMNKRLMTQMVEETGISIQGTLYTDALSEPSGPCPTYVQLMRHNVQILAKAMKLNG